MSTHTLDDLFGLALRHPEARTATPEPLPALPPEADEDHFSTADWYLENGRTARTAASIVHCEQSDDTSLVRRAFASLIGRRATPR